MITSVIVNKRPTQLRLTDLDGITPISADDEILYQYFFEYNKDRSYANNWLYVTQACRNLQKLGLKYHNGESLMSIGKHKEHFVIVRPSGENTLNATHNLAKLLFNISGKPVYIKHLKSDDAGKLLTKSFGYRKMESYPWDINFPKDDDTFPQAIIELQSMVGNALGNSANSKIRLRVNRFNNFFGCLPEFIKYDANNSDQRGQALYIVKKCAKESEPYLNMINTYSNENYSYLMFVKGNLAGFYALGEIADGELGCYANICDYHTYPGLAETALNVLFNELFEMGIKKINLGGSEFRDLHRFKLKFSPSELTYSHHLVYNPLNLLV